MSARTKLLTALLFSLVMTHGNAADVVPNEVKMPGTQPGEVSSLQTANRCDNCHGGYNKIVEPAHNWNGSMMSHAAGDPMFWATMAIAEQDFDGSGDLCLRCHTASGWLSGRSTPTDGSGLSASSDSDGVECDLCHRMTNPDQSEHIGIQNPPFIANDGGTPAVGYYGSGQYVIWNENSKLGPYADAEARHQSLQSVYYRSSDMCGTCHDVSNPVTGDLAHNHGAQVPLAPGTFSGVIGSPVETKAAFNNFPYQYGVVERTYSEHKASLLEKTLVSDFTKLPAELQDGAIRIAYEAATAGIPSGNYADGAPRYFTCQTCHMPAVFGQGCNKRPPFRNDLPLHDLTGGNFWMLDVMQYLDAQDKLLIGGNFTSSHLAAMEDGKLRAMNTLSSAAKLSVTGNTLRVVNLTGHKLISGYPEGRRMWLNIKWFDANNVLLREDGAYGLITATINAQDTQVATLLNPTGANTRIYEAHGAITQEWAKQLTGFGVDPQLPVSFDRVTGAVSYTLGQIAAQAPGTSHETFHFVLNNYLAKDNRIPPYGMAYDASRDRNILPVPANQYGNPAPGGTYNYWDELVLNPPTGAVYASIDLLYQSTSWEYIQFLYRANTGQIAFLAEEGNNLLDAWLNTGMAAPYVMASTTWGTAPTVSKKTVKTAKLDKQRSQ